MKIVVTEHYVRTISCMLKQQCQISAACTPARTHDQVYNHNVRSSRSHNNIGCYVNSLKDCILSHICSRDRLNLKYRPLHHANDSSCSIALPVCAYHRHGKTPEAPCILLKGSRNVTMHCIVLQTSQFYFKRLTASP